MSNDDAQNSQEGSKMDALVKVVLVFFISLLSFSVGTFVGKQVSDSDHRQASLEGDAHSSDTAAAETGDAAHGDSHGDTREVASVSEDDHAPTITDEDVTNLTEEFVESEKPKDKDGYEAFSREKSHPKALSSKESHDTHAAPSHAPTPAPKTAATPQAPVSPATQKIIKGESPTTGKVVEEKRQPSNVLPKVAGSTVGKYTVQVGSYATEGDAKKHANQLKTQGWNAFYVPAEIKGATWYRVSVGLFDDSTNAKSFMQQFQKESNTKNALVQKIVQ